MKGIKKTIKGGVPFIRMRMYDAIELLLFIIFLAAVLGAFFRERFVYIIFAAIIICVWLEMRRQKKEKNSMEKKVEKRIRELKKEKKELDKKADKRKSKKKSKKSKKRE